MKGGAQRVTEKREIFADRSIDSGYDTERERERGDSGRKE